MYEIISDTAKNVILFLGDGMSIPTLTATRAYIGQKRNESGEEASLSFDQFPFTALSKVRTGKLKGKRSTHALYSRPTAWIHKWQIPRVPPLPTSAA